MVGVTRTAAGTWRDEAARLGRAVTIGTTSGMAVGFLVGGVGGRLVMLILRLTSDDRLRGTLTDDDFEIGSFTAGTLFLLFAMTLLGAFGGLLYMGVRRFLPSAWRWAMAGALTGAVGGAVVLDEDGLDFTALDPLLFAVIAFIVLPGAFGVCTSLVVERRMTRPWSASGRWWLSLIPLAMLLVAGPTGVAVIIVVLAAGPLLRTSPPVAQALRSAPVTWLGRVALTALFLLAATHLVGDIRAIL